MTMMIGKFIRNAIGGGGEGGASEKAQVTGTLLMDTIPGKHYGLGPH